MSERITRFMVMDASQDNVRRYWTGHGWATDPLMGVQDGVAGYYWNLYEAGCQAALVMVELSITYEKTIVHSIQVLLKVRYVNRSSLRAISEIIEQNRGLLS